MRLLVAVSAVAVFAAALGPACAQSYPIRPVRIIVGFPPGGGVDIAARIVAQGLTEVWGNQNALVDNRPGAAGGIGTELTATAPPDGYTLMLCQIASHAITPARAEKKLPYDHVRDFAFISMVGTLPNTVVGHPSLPLTNLREVIAYARAHPGQLNYGSAGVGTSPHLSMELIKLTAGISIVSVPYKGAAPALVDVMAGQIELIVTNLPSSLGPITAGKLRGLAVTTATRNTHIPHVPTVAESGLSGYDVSSWYGICTQAAVPKPILAKLHADLTRALTLPATAKRLSDQGIDVKKSTPEEFVAHVRAETERWRKVVREAKIPMQ